MCKIAAFDVFEIGEYVESFLSLPPSDPVNEKFETIGLESLYFISNLGSFFLFLAFYFVAIAIWIILWPSVCIGQFPKSTRDKLGRKLFWNSALSSVFESHLIVDLAAFITLRYDWSFDTKG